MIEPIILLHCRFFSCIIYLSRVPDFVSVSRSHSNMQQENRECKRYKEGRKRWAIVLRPFCAYVVLLNETKPKSKSTQLKVDNTRYKLSFESVYICLHTTFNHLPLYIVRCRFLLDILLCHVIRYLLSCFCFIFFSISRYFNISVLLQFATGVKVVC